jgi:hypothetical protein
MPKLTAKTRHAIKTRVRAEFKKLDHALEQSNPGITEMLKVYGIYEESVRQAAASISSLNAPQPIFSTSDRSILG